MAEDSNILRDWKSLQPEERVRVREEYGDYLDTLPPTCSLGSKIEGFRHCLIVPACPFTGWLHHAG
jgi:hypothetical protein